MIRPLPGKQPHGTFDNTKTDRREFWHSGRLEKSYSHAYIDQDVAKHATAIVNGVKPWGSFPDLS